MVEISDRANAAFVFTQTLRRDIHTNPELGFKEIRTANVVSSYLTEFGYTVRRNVGKTGVTGLLDSGRVGRTLLLRFDMDALPIQEENELEYKSKTPGVMHACGHDGHVAVGITVAKLLAEGIENLHGRIMFAFQPAEEGLGGAEAMLADGLLNEMKPDAALAFHLWNEKPVGWVGIKPGPLMAGADVVKIIVHGKGGHGAIPQEAVDPIIAAAQVLINLQSIVNKDISPLEPAIVSITEFHAGDAHNVIPDQVVLRGSIRSFSRQTRDIIIKRIKEIAKATSEAMRCSVDVEIVPLTPAVINSTTIAAEVLKTAQRLLAKQTIDTNYQVMVSDDMAIILEKIPGCYILIGSADPQGGLVEHHHNPKFNFSESAMQTAVILLTGFAMDYVNNSKTPIE